MNYIKQFMEDNGLKIGERFKIKDKVGIIRGDYFITNGYLLMYEAPETPNTQYNYDTQYNFVKLLSGKHEVVKLPFKPKRNEKYWYITSDGRVDITSNAYYSNDFASIILGNCFRTKEEAEQHRDEIMDKFNKIRQECEQQ